MSDTRPIDCQAWNLLLGAARNCPALPGEVKEVLAKPLAYLLSLPFRDGSKPIPIGIRRRPFWREHSVAASYLDFLEEQIRLEPRGPEWSQRLRVRRDALAPFIDVQLLDYTIQWDDFDATMEVEGQRIVHFELY